MVANEAVPLTEEVYAVKATLSQFAIALEEVLTTYRPGTCHMVTESNNDGLRRLWGRLGPGLRGWYEVYPTEAGTELRLRSASELWDLLAPYRQPILDKLRTLGWIQAANAGQAAVTQWDDTEGKLERLRELRRDAIKRHVKLTWTAACTLAGIDPKTAKKHAPELRGHWTDKTYGI